MSRTSTASMTIYDVIDGAAPVYERAYSTVAGLFSEMGDPTTPGTGVTWPTVVGPAPSTAYWIAERVTLGDDVGDWQLYPVKAKDGGLPFVSYTKSGYNKPVLGDSTWIADAVIAVSAFTGRTYTNQKEFGYGTVVVIEYDNGKLKGTYKRSGSSDTWVDPASFIDGDLIVDGSIAADHIQANSITADQIAAGTITADEITAGTITSAEIAGGTINASKLLRVGSANVPKVADYIYISSAVQDLVVGQADANTGPLYAWLLETVDGFQRADITNDGSVDLSDILALVDYNLGNANAAATSWITTYIDTPIKSVSFTEGTLPDNTQVITHSTVGAVESGGASADINNQASTFGQTVISGGAIKADELNITDMNLTGVLDIALGSGNNGALSWGKTSGGDFSTQGMFFGVEDGNLKFNLGSPSSYIYFDGTNVQLVGTNSVAAVAAPLTQYQSAGTYIIPLTSSNNNQSITVTALGGGGGGGAGGRLNGGSSPGGGAGYFGGNTTIKLFSADGNVLRQSITAYGGDGGAYQFGHDVGEVGESAAYGGIFAGTGGSSGANAYSARGGNATGNGAGGGGAGDTYNNKGGGGGGKGESATATWAVVSNTDYIEITVGSRGDRGFTGTGNQGVNYPKYGGHGSSGAAEIEFT